MLRKTFELFFGKSNNNRKHEHRYKSLESDDIPDDGQESISIEISDLDTENPNGEAENINAGAENRNGEADSIQIVESAEIQEENLPTNYAAIQVQDTEILNGEGATRNINYDSETKLSESPHATFFTANDLTPAEIDDLLFIHQSEYSYFIQVLLIQPEIVEKFLRNEIDNARIKKKDILECYLVGAQFLEYIHNPEKKESAKEYLSLVSAYTKLIAKVSAYERICAKLNAKVNAKVGAYANAYYANIVDNPNLYAAQQALLEFFKNQPGLKNTLVSNILLVQTAFLFVHNYKQGRSNSDDNENNNNNNNFNSPRG